MADPVQPTTLTLACAMSGERETLTVLPIGRFGVAFNYGEDASVIVSGDDLKRVRAILDRQIAAWEAANAE